MIIYFKNRRYLPENGLIPSLSHYLINFLKMRLDGIIIDAEKKKMFPLNEKKSKCKA